MTTAVGARIPASGAAASGGRVPKVGPRRRLFAKYALALVGLVSLVLLVNGLLNVWFSYDEAKDVAIRLQHEKADAAAQHIEEFISEIEKQIGWTTATQWASSPIDQRRFDYGRLQRQVPAITELIQLDGQGHEQLKVSRLAMDVVGTGANYSADPRFTEALAKKVWFGPVYFRKESEPYMTMAVAQSGRNAGVTVAEVNLKLIWDVITAIKIGKSGYAYVVDGEGRLIAHPDISRVLRNTDLSALPQVAAARSPAAAGAEPTAIVHNLDGRRVLSASAAIPRLGWLVFVEQPISEALAPLYTTVLNTGLLLVLGLAVAILAGLLLARRMTGPIRELDAGAARIGAGALDHRIAVHTGDELEELAKRFNTMASDLQSSYADLEKKVEDRTAELKEALDQQTATAEVLGVINSSPSDLTPVFSAILEKTHGLCGIIFGTLQLYDGERLRAVATRGFPEPLEQVIREPYAPEPNSPLLGLINGGRFVQIRDLAEHDTQVPNPRSRVAVNLGIRTLLFLPLRKDNLLLGLISAARTEAKLFSEREIALLENFAAQAVIAMENARLITETHEALDQQTATAEVLGVINSSPGDLTPVFDAILEKATRLCEAEFGFLWIYGDGLLHVAAHHNAPPTLAEFLTRAPHRVGAENAHGRLLRGEAVVHIADAMADEAYRSGDPIRRAFIELGGARALLAVPLRKEETFLGDFVMHRKEVGPFSDKQIALLQNFAAQAVIAMENARLITETREALEQQTATAEVLGVINSSPGDLVPVFDAMLDKAMRLCSAAFGYLMTYDGERFQEVAHRGLPPRFAEYLPRMDQPGPSGAYARIKAGAPLVHIADLKEGDVYLTSPLRQALVDLGGARTSIIVALRKDEALLGVLTIYRQEIRPFSEKQIALLQNFAAQAVIAMENARLLTETREALEQQTATAEVLGAINSSPGDLAPVFDAMLDKALHLCSADYGVLWIRDGDAIRAGAIRGASKEFTDFLLRERVPVDADMLVARAVRERSVVHVRDTKESEPYRRGVPLAVFSADRAGIRTILMVPLSKEDEGLGLLTIYRREVRLFTDKEIALLENFAAQAVIAMENARLITETREALEQQTATSEVLHVISSSPGDLAPVFQTVLENAVRICEAKFGTLYLREADGFRGVAMHNVPPAFAEARTRGLLRPPPDAPLGQVAATKQVAHITDIRAMQSYIQRDPFVVAAAESGGYRTVLSVPMLKDNELIGAININRQEVRPFTDKQIELVKSFASQAVIAIENARLLNELRQRTRDLQESLEYQTATSDVLKVISHSGAELEPVLERLVETAARICEADKALIMRLQDGFYRVAAAFGYSPEFIDLMARNRLAPDAGTVTGRTALERRVVHIHDTADNPDYRPEPLHAGEHRTALGVPLFRDETVVGVIFLARSRVEPFSEKQIALVSTFADQAVIAIENARLFNELRERTSDLGRSVEELKMLSDVGQAVSSTLDLRAVLSAILTASLGVTWANAGAVYRYSRAEHAFRLVEAVGWDEALTRSVSDLRIAETETAMGEAVARRMPVQLADTAQRASYPLRDLTLAAGFHSALIVPLVGPERILGAIILMRKEAGEFPPETVRLMQTLASQSVLAIQNARLFREIADKSEQLALASQHKSQFLANMSHELRTPLNAILGYAELLVDGIYGVLADRPKGVLERIQNNGKHLLALINDVLDLAKIEAGQLTLTLEDYALAEVVRSVVTATEPLATAKGLKFTATLQDGMPMGHGDARRVSQVLLNLVGNAIKFTDVGEVEIRASSANGQFVLTVRDTGPGIPDADQDRIFGEFQQIDNSNTRQKGGTGLGLAISKRMVEMQGGTIAVESALGQGSTFRVVLPVHVDEMMEAAE